MNQFWSIDLELIHNYRQLLFIDMLYMGVTQCDWNPACLPNRCFSQIVAVISTIIIDTWFIPMFVNFESQFLSNVCTQHISELMLIKHKIFTYDDNPILVGSPSVNHYVDVENLWCRWGKSSTFMVDVPRLC